MKTRILTVLLGVFLITPHAYAQEKTVTGTVTSEQGTPLSSVSVVIRGTTVGTVTNNSGMFSVRAAPGQVLQFRLIGTAPAERTVGASNVINVALTRVATSLDAFVVTALGQTTQQRALGTSQQQVSGAEIAGTQRENFVNALQGRVAGVEVTTTSGLPGSSSSITIRGVSSISSSNQPLMVIDGLPVDNKTLNSNVLASGAPGSSTDFANRSVDFSSRSGDINPEDIETLTVLKGPEASALYGIDAANGAIIITTKRGKPGTSGLTYSNRFRVENVRAKPQLQRTFGPTSVAGGALGSFQYFGAPYDAGTKFYDNVDGFFRTGVTQSHNLDFSGATADSRMNYRVASAFTKQEGVVPNSGYNRINLTGSTGAEVTSWLKSDLSMLYSYSTADKVFKGDGGPFIGLVLWPQTDNAQNYLTPAGTRRQVTNLSAGSEVDDPYFNIYKNPFNERTNRIYANGALTLTKWKFADLSTRLGVDAYTQQNLILRHPESAYGLSNNGVIDQGDDINRIINSQTLLNVNRREIGRGFSMYGTLGNAVQDKRSTYDGLYGVNFLDPNFVSINNAQTKSSRQVNAQRRLFSYFGSATADWNNYLFLTVTGRNDWTSTIPLGANRFFYPGVNTSFIATDAFPALRKFATSVKLRAGYAEVGRDAEPYSDRPSLEAKSTSYVGYGYGFTGPNVNLRPEFARAYEAGIESNYLDDRLGLDFTVYRKQTKDQIVQNIRGSYATGYILFNLNGAETRNQGVEVTARATPVLRNSFGWDIIANYSQTHGVTLKLPNDLPEAYVSDTWLYGNVRNGTAPGLSTMSLTGLFYLRNKAGALLIDPTTGLPLRSSTFIDAGYDRQPKWTMGVTNVFRMGRFSLNALVDLRRGGDVFNATEQFLTSRGLAMSTLDRETPRVVTGVLRDGRENSANPTKNTLVVIPSNQPTYYTNISEELFIEKDINWVRLRDVTLSMRLPERVGHSASVFITGTDLFLLTNYTGLDPISNGTSASVGGSGGVGIDYGNFPIPRGLNFGLRTSF
ncbi:SusC/RagA family TonB-linked outer membrane protein [soil metagenome]